MKSHDCLVLMQQLLPIAFDVLPKPQWTALTEISQYFRELTSTLLNVEKLMQMEKNIPIILCKLEQFLPPGFFDSMEHLPVHLAYEARICGPVQYRWMYPFERFLKTLKYKVKNKAHVEASICQAYLLEEASTLATYYFPAAQLPCRMNRGPHIDDGSNGLIGEQISIFNYLGRSRGKNTPIWQSNRGFNASKLYILRNCPEVGIYLK